MPLLQNQDTFTMRIQHGEVEIRRVYLGETLMWGLYDVTYHLAGGTQGSNPVGEYVWGVVDIDLPKPTWAGQQYYTKFFGWYEGTTYVTAVPAITKDFHKDLDLYAKWTQRKYTYSGTYMWTWVEEVWVDGGDSEEENAEGVSFSAYTNTSPVDMWQGQCTYYCQGRSETAFGTPCLTGYPDACNWLTGGRLGSGWTRIPGGSPQPGDVVVFDDAGVPGGHVIFQETSSIITQSNVRVPDYSGGPWARVIAGRHERFSCVSIGTPSRYVNCNRLGVLRYTGSGGGGGGGGMGHTEYITHTEYGNVSETECPSQKPPTLPNPPQGSWVNTTQLTYTRDYNYQNNNWGGWTQSASSWDTSGDGWQ